MAKIIVTNDFVPREGIRLDNPSVAAVPGESQVRAGEKQLQAAERLLQNSIQNKARSGSVAAAHAAFALKAKRSRDNALANNAHSSAMAEFVIKSNERLNTKLDDKGNPTFEQIPKDLMDIGLDISKRYSKNLDPDAAPLFHDAFAGFISDRLPSILDESRRQQVDFTRASLSKTMDTLKSTAITDDFTNFPMYERQTSKVLAAAIADGSISSVEAESMSQKFRGEVAVNNLNKIIFNDPKKALDILKNSSPEDLGLTGGEYSSGLITAEQRNIQMQKELARKEEKEQAKKAALNLSVSTQLASRASYEYEQGRLGDEDLQKIESDMWTSPDLPPDAKMSMQEQFARSRDKKYKEAIEGANLASLVASGDVEGLSTLKGEEKNKGFSSMLEAIEQTRGQEVTLTERMNLLADTKTEIPQETDRLKSISLGGDAESVIEAGKSLMLLEDKNLAQYAALEGTTEGNILLSAYEKNRYNGMDPEEAVKSAREEQLAPHSAEKNAKIANVFKNAVEGGTMKAILDNVVTSQSDITPFARTDIAAEMEDIAMRTFRGELQRANGNAIIAKKITEKRLKQQVGITQLTKAMQQEDLANTEGNWKIPFTDTNINPIDTVVGTLTYYPPEMIIPDVDYLKYDLKKSTDGLLPEGLTEEDVGYTYVDNPNMPNGVYAYALHFTGKDKIRYPLKDENGQQAYFIVDPRDYQAYKAEREGVKQAQVQEKAQNIQDGNYMPMPPRGE